MTTKRTVRGPLIASVLVAGVAATAFAAIPKMLPGLQALDAPSMTVQVQPGGSDPAMISYGTSTTAVVTVRADRISPQAHAN